MNSCPVKYRTEKHHINYPDGNSYHGEMLFGMKHGFGTFTSTSGQIYRGEFLFDKMEGEGRTENKDCKCRFIGLFENNKKVGFGRRISCQGDVVDGIYENDELNYGTIYFVNGDRYVGKLYSLRPHGKGKMFFRLKKLTENGIWKYGERKQESNETVFRKSNLYDAEADVMNSFRNGNSDAFGY